MKISYYIVVSPIFTDNSRIGKVIMYSTKTGIVRIIDSRTWEKINKNDFNIEETILNELLKEGFLIHDDIDELQEIISYNKEKIASDSVLYYVIQPTESCQLGCVYCGQKHTSKKLSSVEQSKIINILESQIQKNYDRYKSIKIGWFGGEPLSALKVIEDMSLKIEDISKKYQIPYTAKIVTNGLSLDKETFEKFTKWNITDVEITLDGTKEYHDKKRFTKAGLDSFDKIFHNLLEVANLESKIHITIRSNVDMENYVSIPNLINLLHEKGLHKKVQYYVSPVYSWGNDAHLNSFNNVDFAKLEVEWISQMLSLGFKVNLIPNRKPIVCMSVKENSFVFDAKGNVFNCTEIPYVPQYEKNDDYIVTKTNNFNPDNIKISMFGGFNDEILNRNFDCSSCKMLPVCGGACPKQWKEGFVPCPTTKFNIPEKLLLYYIQQKPPQTAGV